MPPVKATAIPPLPANPDIRRQLKDRLHALSPRAFEFFASDLLTYVGIQNVTVTRFIGDGGIDAQRESYFFRRDRIDAIRSHLGLNSQPASSTEWRQAFLDYVRGKNLTKSYKPVLIKALLRLVNRHGEVQISALTQEFHAFYLQRERDNLLTEAGSPLENPSALTLETVQKLIVKHPLERFLLQHFLEYDRQAGIVRFAPQLWAELRFYELLDVQASADEQLRYYYDRLG